MESVVPKRPEQAWANRDCLTCAEHIVCHGLKSAWSHLVWEDWNADPANCLTTAGVLLSFDMFWPLLIYSLRLQISAIVSAIVSICCLSGYSAIVVEGDRKFLAAWAQPWPEMTARHLRIIRSLDLSSLGAITNDATWRNWILQFGVWKPSRARWTYHEQRMKLRLRDAMLSCQSFNIRLGRMGAWRHLPSSCAFWPPTLPLSSSHNLPFTSAFHLSLYEIWRAASHGAMKITWLYLAHVLWSRPFALPRHYDHRKRYEEKW